MRRILLSAAMTAATLLTGCAEEPSNPRIEYVRVDRFESKYLRAPIPASFVPWKANRAALLRARPELAHLAERHEQLGGVDDGFIDPQTLQWLAFLVHAKPGVCQRMERTWELFATTERTIAGRVWNREVSRHGKERQLSYSRCEDDTGVTIFISIPRRGSVQAETARLESMIERAELR